MRDWIIDCAVRWQRRHKPVVPRAGAQADEVAAVIGPRHAALRALLPAMVAPQAAPALAEPPVEHELIVPMPADVPAAVAPEPEVSTAPAEPELDVSAVLAEPEPTQEEAPEKAPMEEAPVAQAPMEQPVLEAQAVVAAAPMPPAPAPAPADRPELDLSQMSDWQVLILSGPAGSGKSSIAQQFCEILPRSVHIKVEPLRDKAYSLLVAQPLSHEGQETGAKAEVFSGKTEEARQQAADLACAYIHTGHRVIIDDVIESATDLKVYQDGLTDVLVRTVSLMPSLDEMERRDKMRPVDQQAGSRIKEHHVNMVRQLSAHSSVLDISQETVQETVQRILILLQQAE
jgi:chloramphenicol 3-O-phosphotransferase